MKWSDFDTARKRMRVWSSKKNKAEPWRDIDLVDSLFPLMLLWMQEHMGAGNECIISFKEKPVKSIKTAWKTCKRNAGIFRRLRPYDPRHAFATETIAKGADQKPVSEIMGHNDISMIHHHYQHVLDKQKKEAVESVPDILSGIKSGEHKRGF